MKAILILSLSHEDNLAARLSKQLSGKDIWGVGFDFPFSNSTFLDQTEGAHKSMSEQNDNRNWRGRRKRSFPDTQILVYISVVLELPPVVTPF